MKVICPECSAEYDVPVPMLGTSGRRVRCSNCGHIWMADLETATESGFGSFHRFDENLDIEPIPSSVHPEEEDDLGHGHTGTGVFASINKGYLARLAAGFGLACLLIAIFLGIGVMTGLNNGVLRPFFVPFGLAGTVQVVDLNIEDVVAKSAMDAAGQPMLVVTGRVHNPGEDETDVPQIEITLLSETGVEGDSLQIELEEKSLEGGKDAKFEAILPGGAEPKGQVRVRFIL